MRPILDSPRARSGALADAPNNRSTAAAWVRALFIPTEADYLVTMTDHHWGLPDPDLHAEFYEGVASKRLAAWVIDTLLIVAITLLTIPLSFFVALFFLPLVGLAVNILYRAVTLSRHSATPGMRFMAIEFRTAQGLRMDPATALLHTLGYTLSISMVLPQIVSIFLMLTGRRGQGLIDHALGTVAINRAADI